MKMTTALLSGVVLGFYLISSTWANDESVYNPSGCVVAGASDPAAIPYFGGGTIVGNDSTYNDNNELLLVCPLPKKNIYVNDPISAQISVVDTHYYQDVSCTFTIWYVDPYTEEHVYITNKTKTTTGLNIDTWRELEWSRSGGDFSISNTIDGDKTRQFGMMCTIPAMDPYNNRSYIGAIYLNQSN